MVAEFKTNSHPEWVIHQQLKPFETDRVFILLAVRNTYVATWHRSPVSASIFHGPDVESAKQAAHALLRRDSDIKHVAVMEEDGTSLIGIATRTASGWQVPSYPAHISSYH